MPRKEGKSTGPPEQVIDRLIEVHSDTGTLERVANSGIGEKIEENISSEQGYMAGYTLAFGVEPWSYDGQLLTMLADIYPGEGSSYPSGFTWFNGDLYFNATDPTSGFELRKLDGETGEVSLVADINPGGDGSGPDGFTVFDGDLYFSATDPENGRELHKLDGETGEVSLVADINPGDSRGGNSSRPANLTEFNGDLYFTATDLTGTQGLHKLDGETGEVSRVYAGSAADFTVFNGDLYFGDELRKLDGETGEISLVDDPGNDWAFPHGFTEFNGDLYFSAVDKTSGRELHKLDGETGEVSLVADINPSDDRNNSSDPANLTVFNGDLYFTAYDPTNGRELHKLDGETGGVSLVADIYSGSESSSPHGFAEFNGDLYFTAYDPTNGFELRKLDGETGSIYSFDFFDGTYSEFFDRSYVIGVVNDALVIAAYIDETGDGAADRLAMLVSHGEPTSVDDFTVVDDGSGTFSPASLLYVLEAGDYLI